MLASVLINLDRNPERLAFMTEQFAAIQLPFERFPAIDGPALGAAAFQTFASERPLELSGDSYARTRVWTPAMMGCLLSHVAVWQKAAQAQQQFTAIFEDDVHLSPIARDCLADDVWIPADADVVRLETTSNRIYLRRRPASYVAGHDVRRYVPLPIQHCWPIGAAAYILSRDGARKLMSISERWHTITDLFMFNGLESPAPRELVTYQVCPSPCIQDKFLHPEDGDVNLASNLDTAEYRAWAKSRRGSLRRKVRTAALLALGLRKVPFSKGADASRRRAALPRTRPVPAPSTGLGHREKPLGPEQGGTDDVGFFDEITQSRRVQ